MIAAGACLRRRPRTHHDYSTSAVIAGTLCAIGMVQTRLRPTLLVFAAAMMLVTALPARAQQPPPPGQPALTINQLDSSAYPDLRAVVSAFDGSGAPAPGLAVAQFEAFDGDTPVVVASVQSAQDAKLPLSVVLAIHISNGMAGEPLDRMTAAAVDFIDALGPNDEASIVVFNQKVTPVVPFTSDRTALTNGIAGLQASGGTALYDAVQTTTYLARVANAPRSAVVLFTDAANDETDSPATADSSLAAAKGAGVPVFTIGFGGAPDVTYLQRLSAATRGQYHAAETATVGTVYNDVGTLLRNQYVFTLKAFSPVDGKDASLRLVANIDGTRTEAFAPFARGKSPPATTSTKANGRLSATQLFAYAVVAAIVILGLAGGAIVTWRQMPGVLRTPLDLVARSLDGATTMVPRAGGTWSSWRAKAGTGRLVEQLSTGPGRVFELRDGPAVIGSAVGLCTIVLEDDDVAPEHVRICLEDGRYVLHHAVARRRTLVNGREQDGVRLEAGDELQIGHHRFFFEDERRRGARA